MADQRDGLTKIEAPNKSYTGVGPNGLAFADGVAYTDNPVLIDYCARHGYKVSGPDAPEKAPATVAEDPQTVRQGHQNLSAPSEDASASRAMTEDQRRAAYGEGVGQMLEKEGVSPPYIAAGPVVDPNEEPQTNPGGTEQVGLTRDQAEHAAAVRAGLAAPAKTTRAKTTKTSETKSTRSRKSGGSSKSGGSK